MMGIGYLFTFLTASLLLDWQSLKKKYSGLAAIKFGSLNQPSTTCTQHQIWQHRFRWMLFGLFFFGSIFSTTKIATLSLTNLSLALGNSAALSAMVYITLDMLFLLLLLYLLAKPADFASRFGLQERIDQLWLNRKQYQNSVIAVLTVCQVLNLVAQFSGITYFSYSSLALSQMETFLLYQNSYMIGISYLQPFLLAALLLEWQALKNNRFLVKASH